MPRIMVGAVSFVAGLVVGGLMAFAWGWITFARGHSGIDYPELERLTRMVCVGAAVEGATGYIAGLSLLSRKFAIGWALGLIPRFALAFLPSDRTTNTQYWFVFLVACFIPALTGVAAHRLK